MKPVLAVVGRPNVGKSTLFNRMTQARNAIVVDVPGVTRDRHYGEGRIEERAFIVIDTGGLEPGTDSVLGGQMGRQAEQAIEECDAVLFVVDARAGLTSTDRDIAGLLRRIGQPVWVVANKAEGLEPQLAGAEFHELGLGAPQAISASHGDGVRTLIGAVLDGLPDAGAEDGDHEDGVERAPRVAIVGRPNVGKSTLVNALVGEERVIATDLPGTTRDAIDVPFERAGVRYTLVDTAGLRRRGKQGETVERFSIVRTLQAIEAANVVILVLDASEPVSDQDAHIAGYILEQGRALVVAVNKWDRVPREERDAIKQMLDWRLGFLGFADWHMISAKSLRGLGGLMRSVGLAYRSAMAKLSTPRLTRALIAAVARQAPPRSGHGRPKLRYAHQGGMNPPRIIVHGNALERVPETYRRYLEGVFRKAFDLHGTPLAIEFRTGANPYSRK